MADYLLTAKKTVQTKSGIYLPGMKFSCADNKEVDRLIAGGWAEESKRSDKEDVGLDPNNMNKPLKKADSEKK